MYSRLCPSGDTRAREEVTLTASRWQPPAKKRPGSAMTRSPDQSEKRDEREELMTSEIDLMKVRGGEGSVPGQEGNPPPMSRSVNLERALIYSRQVKFGL